MSKTALITGASNGIGYELARVHAEKGVNMVLVARSKNKLEELRREIEEKHKVWVYTVGKDLSVPGAAREVYDELKTKSISIDYLINNAGVGDFGLFSESDWTRQEQMINLNITALTHFTRLFLPDMICRGGGRIMNLASTASFQPGPTMSVYFATKAFVLSFSEALSYEVKQHNISVTAFCPGATHSGFQAATSQRDARLFEGNKFPSARKVAEYGYRAMIKGKAVAIHGFKNSIIINSIRFVPRSLVLELTKRIQTKKYKAENKF
jgi:short-subunit dehydrogenase